MRIKQVNVKNFRLLRDVTLCLEDRTTVIVGRNNSGKTSFTELFRRFLHEGMLKFELEDFCLDAHGYFWNAFEMVHREGGDELLVRDVLPIIEVMFHIEYDPTVDYLGVLSDFIVDLEPKCTEAIVKMKYQLKEGQVPALFHGLSIGANNQGDIKRFYRVLRERIPKLYEVSICAINASDPDGKETEVKLSALRELIGTDFITAQRGLDDTTYREKDVLGKVLERLFAEPSEDLEGLALELEGVVEGIQEKLDSGFNTRLHEFLPALSKFGYPGLSDSQLLTETILDVNRLLSNHTKIRYETHNQVGLPETYNGLGSRNLIYILFQLYEFFKAYQTSPTAQGVHLIFIEEPEAHLHPQMQEVFVRQINNIVDQFSIDLDVPWPVQFVITTHSTHMANEAPFDSIRYFMSSRNGKKHTVVKDLRLGFSDESYQQDKEFLQKYMTLARCDLFFADKAILIEGPTERLLMPRMIKTVDQETTERQLSSQYISIVEVGGAYAHHFYRLLDFLKIRSLIISDLDSVKQEDGKGPYSKCKVREGTRTSNACIKNWFENDDISPTTLLEMATEDKVKNLRRIAYQIPETGSDACGRSFEDAFLLANKAVKGSTDIERADAAWTKAQTLNKTKFAMDLALDDEDWMVPHYIKEGLQWLTAGDDISANESPRTSPSQLSEEEA